jgi:predicted Zn-dependent protease
VDPERPRRRAEELLLARVYDEESPRLLAALLRARLASGELRRAARALADLRRRAPRDPETASLAAELALARGRAAKARGAARRAFARDSTWPRGRRLVEILEAQGHRRAALEVLRGATASNPRRPAPARAWARRLAASGRFEAARAARALAAHRAEAPRRDLLALVRADHRLGEDRVALARARALVEAWPSDPAVRRIAVAAALWAGRTDVAENLAREGLSLGVLSRREVAERFAREGIFGGSAQIRGWMSAARGALPPAARWRLAPSPAVGRRRLAAVRPEDSGYVAARRLLAEVLRDAGRLEAAERVLRRGKDRAVTSSAAEVLGRAAEQLRQAREQAPDAEGPSGLAGRLDGGEARPEDGSALAKLRGAHPDDPRALALHGRWLALSGDLPHGRDALERAARLHPRDAILWAWLAEARALDGDAREAEAARARARARAEADARARRASGGLFRDAGRALRP